MVYIPYNKNVKYEVIFYEDIKGKRPVEEFLDSLDIKMRYKIVSYIELLETYGADLKPPYSKHLEDGIFELRVKFASNITRTLYFF